MTDLMTLLERLGALSNRVGGLLEIQPRREFYYPEEVLSLFSTYEKVRLELVRAHGKFRDLPEKGVPELNSLAPLPGGKGGIERWHVEQLHLDIKQAIDLIGDPSDDDIMGVPLYSR